MLVDATCNLGLIYANGDGVPKYMEDALRYYKIATERDKNAACKIGAIYASGVLSQKACKLP